MKTESLSAAKVLSAMLDNALAARAEIENLKKRSVALREEETKLLASGAMDHQPTIDSINSARVKVSMIPGAIERQQAILDNIKPQLEAACNTIVREGTPILERVQEAGTAALEKLLQAVIADAASAREQAENTFWKTDFGKALGQVFGYKNHTLLGAQSSALTIDNAAMFISWAESVREVEAKWAAIAD